MNTWTVFTLWIYKYGNTTFKCQLPQLNAENVLGFILHANKLCLKMHGSIFGH